MLLHLVVAVLYHACMRLPRLKLLERAAAMRSTPRILEVLVLLPAQVTPPPTPQSWAGLAPRPPGGSRALLGWGPWLLRNKASLLQPSAPGPSTLVSGQSPASLGTFIPERGQGGCLTLTSSSLLSRSMTLTMKSLAISKFCRPMLSELSSTKRMLMGPHLHSAGGRGAVSPGAPPRTPPKQGREGWGLKDWGSWGELRPPHPWLRE